MDDKYPYLVIHSGSRHLGTEVARWYQEEGYRALAGNTYPANASTSGMTADEISQGLYYRTDKGNKGYNQEGKDQGYCVGRPEVQKTVEGTK